MDRPPSYIAKQNKKKCVEGKEESNARRVKIIIKFNVVGGREGRGWKSKIKSCQRSNSLSVGTERILEQKRERRC